MYCLTLPWARKLWLVFYQVYYSSKLLTHPNWSLAYRSSDAMPDEPLTPGWVPASAALFDEPLPTPASARGRRTTRRWAPILNVHKTVSKSIKIHSTIFSWKYGNSRNCLVGKSTTTIHPSAMINRLKFCTNIYFRTAVCVKSTATKSTNSKIPQNKTLTVAAVSLLIYVLSV